LFCRFVFAQYSRIDSEGRHSGATYRHDERKELSERKPGHPAGLRREGRLTRIAKALPSGATITDIAEAEGIGRTLASRTANSPECRQLIAEFVNAEHVEMRAMFYRSVRAIEHALSSRREYLTKEGETTSAPRPRHSRSKRASRNISLWQLFLYLARRCQEPSPPKEEILNAEVKADVHFSNRTSQVTKSDRRAILLVI
jgi:hypothetical protein